MRAFIGVTCSADPDGNPRVNPRYVRAVHTADGLPVPLPWIRSANEAHAVLERLDGVLLTGSEDLDPSLWSDAAKEQEQRLIEDPWSDFIQAYIDTHQLDRVLTRELLSAALQLPPHQLHQGSGKRVRGIMANLGWKYHKALRVRRGPESEMGAGYTKEGGMTDENPLVG